MKFNIDDHVIHSTFGLGQITQIEEKPVHGHLTNCYVVRIAEMTVWVPVDDQENNNLRLPTPPEKFIKTIPILTSPTEILQEDRLLRKKQLTDQLKDGQLASICRVVRDLTHYQHNSKLNDQEKSILERAVKSLLTEWTLTMGMPFQQAQQAMESMLQS
jgi:RNA polymerase-interacting CarD/CdnL/TRCF family regulator